MIVFRTVMRSEEDLEIRITFIEDQLNRMNVVLAAQGRRIDEMTRGVAEMMSKIKVLEEEASGQPSFSYTGDSATGGPSERVPDGRNR